MDLGVCIYITWFIISEHHVVFIIVVVVRVPVRVKFYGAIRHELEVDELVIDDNAGSIRDLLQAIVRRLGDKAKRALFDEATGDLRTGLIILLNGTPAMLSGGLDASVYEGDEVVIDRVEIIEVEGGG